MKKINRSKFKLWVLVGLYAVYLIDLLSTILVLEFVPNSYETRALGAYFFSLGWYGYLIDAIVVFMTIFVLIYLFIGVVCIKLYEKIKNKKASDIIFLMFFGILAIVLLALEIPVIIHNFSIFLKWRF